MIKRNAKNAITATMIRVKMLPVELAFNCRGLLKTCPGNPAGLPAVVGAGLVACTTVAMECPIVLKNTPRELRSAPPDKDTELAGLTSCVSPCAPNVEEEVANDEGTTATPVCGSTQLPLPSSVRYPGQGIKASPLVMRYTAHLAA